MNKNKTKPRRQQILECLAAMLEASPGARITTAALASEVGVSEAALYRHFPSKSKMFEGLIAFIEETIFSRAKLIADESITAIDKCQKIIYMLLTFAERNPGISRILTGDALAGEVDRLRQRIAQFFERLETQMRQILRQAQITEGLQYPLSVNAIVSMMMALADGRISQFVRSDFKRAPTNEWSEQWSLLERGVFV